MKNLVIALLMFVSTLGPAVIIGMVGKSAVRAVGRNPSAAPKILLVMMISFIFAEAVAIMAILLVFSLFK